MRKYAQFPPSFWVEAKNKRHGLNTTIVSAYLRTSPHSNLIYLYSLHPAYAAADIGMPIEDYMAALNNLISDGDCAFDQETNTVWLRQVMLDDIGASLNKADKRVMGIQSIIKGLPNSRVLEEFKSEFRVKYQLNYKPPKKGPSKGASKGASKQGEGEGEGEVKPLPYQEGKVSTVEVNRETGEIVDFQTAQEKF